jgi:chromosome segregation ATPase
MPLTRWNDDRLDDLAQSLRSQGNQLNALIDLRVEMAGLTQELNDVSGDTKSCVEALENLKRDLEKRSQEQIKERKADRRWMVATFLTTAGLIVAALAIFLG